MRQALIATIKEGAVSGGNCSCCSKRRRIQHS